MTGQLLLGALLAIAVSLLSLRLGFLTMGGSLAASCIGTISFGLGGFQFALPLLLFFFSSSTLSKLPKSGCDLTVFEKSSRRDASQVLANGGISAILVLAWFMTQNEAYYFGYLGSLAAVTADTWGTEIGMLAHGKTVSPMTFRYLPLGASGAISLPGTVAGAVGAALISAGALPWVAGAEWSVVFVIVVAGVLGSFLDSFVGASMQAQFLCSECGRLVERGTHCGVEAEFHKGLRWLTNDWVNVTCACAGGAAAWFFWESI